MVLQPISLPPTAITGANAAQLRTARTEPVDSPARVQTDPSAVLTSQSVVLHFGTQALNLARGAGTSSPATTAPDPFDTDEADAALNALTSRDEGGLLANAFGPNQTNAALISALDASARQALLLTPGALEPESGLFADQPLNDLESGFFRLPKPPTPDSLLSQSLDYGREPGFLAPPANDTLESTFPFAPAETTESGFFTAPNVETGESGFFPSARSGTESAFPPPNTLESAFPLAATTTTTEALFPQSLTPDTLASTFPRALNEAPEPTFPRAPVANEDATGIFQPPEATARGTAELSSQQQREIDTLNQTERQLRADEQAQRAAAGGYADGVQLRYELGPDGRRYVVSADVPLDVTPIPGDPAATLRKMEVIMRAANAGTASVSDQNASAQAAQLARQARAQLAASRYAEAQEF